MFSEKNGEKFYGPASDCAQLSLLGHTLNGYYLVNHNKQIDNNKTTMMGTKGNISDDAHPVDMVNCAFSNPENKGIINNIWMNNY